MRVNLLAKTGVSSLSSLSFTYVVSSLRCITEALLVSLYLSGLGQAHTVMASYVIIPYYFKRRVGMANAIMSSGGCIGGMVGAPAVTFLQEQFGFRGGTFIVAAFALNQCLAGALFRPLEKPNNVRKATENTDMEAKDKERKGKENKHMVANNSVGESTSADIGEDKTGHLGVVRQMASSLGMSLKLIKSTHVDLLIAGGTLIIVVYMNLFALVPFVFLEYGHTQEAAAECLSVANVFNLASRFLMAICSDFPWLNIRGCFIIFAVLASILTAGEQNFVLAVCDLHFSSTPQYRNDRLELPLSSHTLVVIS